MEEKTKYLVQVACEILNKRGVDTGSGHPVITLLAGDGSQREFYRLCFENDLSFILITPTEGQKQGMAEALSSWSIGNHLYHRGVPVPELLGFNSNIGLIVSEDMGDVRLYEYIHGPHQDENSQFAVYRKIVRKLVRMQINGREGFDTSWCWQSGHYDRLLMLEKETGYFHEALVNDFMGLETHDSTLETEFKDLADQASKAPSGFFLHRDFQSRNIMLKEGVIRFIDYQGGRLGPLGYDLASLLIDPYVGLPEKMQEMLIDEYVMELKKNISYDIDQFRQEFIYLSLQRNLQMLGAFAFLSKQRNKSFFRQYIPPALNSLQSLLAKPLLQKYSALKQTTEICLAKAQPYDI